MKYIKGLDTLRAFAVLIVVFGHWTGPKGMLVRILVPQPRFGVDLFFVLSGFLITSILLQANDSGESRPKIIKTFIIRRTLRIFPVYYATLFILILIGFPFVPQYKIWFLTYTSNILAFIQHEQNPLFPTWSLAVEEQFYLVWPWLLVFARPKYLKYVFYLAIGIGVIITIINRLPAGEPNNYVLYLMPGCLHAFGIGALYAYLKRNNNERQFVRVINTILFPIALLCHLYWAFANGGHLNYFYRFADCIISIWLIHHVIAIRPGWVKSKIVENRVLIAIGRVSYGIYLFHIGLPIIYEMAVSRWVGIGSPTGVFLMKTPVSLSICLVFLFALAFASFEYFEKPFLRLKKYFEYGKAKPRSAGEVAS